MSGPELRPPDEIPRERFLNPHTGELSDVVWPEARKPPRLSPGDDHTPPLDDPDDWRWLREGDPRRRELEGGSDGDA